MFWKSFDHHHCSYHLFLNYIKTLSYVWWELEWVRYICRDKNESFFIYLKTFIYLFPGEISLQFFAKTSPCPLRMISLSYIKAYFVTEKKKKLAMICFLIDVFNHFKSNYYSYNDWILYFSRITFFIPLFCSSHSM